MTSLPLSFEHIVERGKAIFDTYEPLVSPVYKLCEKISKIFSQFVATEKNFFPATSQLFQDLAPILSVLFVPLHVYQMVQITKTLDSWANKALDILLEVGGVFNFTFALVDWFTVRTIVQEAGAAIPYLLGVSIIFQIAEIYKKACHLHRAIHFRPRIEDLTEKISTRTLTANDKELLITAFKVDDLDKFNGMNKEKIRNDLDRRIGTIHAHAVLLTASIIECIASTVLTVGCIVAPGGSPAFLIANFSLIGSSCALKIAAFFLNYHHTTLLKEADEKIVEQDPQEQQPLIQDGAKGIEVEDGQ